MSCVKVPQSRKSSFLLPFLLFIIIFISDDTLTFGTNANKLYIYSKYLIYCVIFILLLMKFGKKILVHQSTLYMFVILMAIFSTALVNFDFRLDGYGYQIMIIALAFLITQFLKIKQFLFIFNRYVYIICIISILVFIVANSFSWVLFYFPINENVAGHRFVNLYIGALFLDTDTIRNTGIFREPGVFMIYILMGIIIELFYCDKINIKHLSSYFIALITTFSTAAFIILFVLCIGYLLRENSKVPAKYKFLILFFIGIFIGILIFNDVIYATVFSKLHPDTANPSSFSRLVSIVSDFRTFMDNPILGSGYSNYSVLFQAHSEQYLGVFIPGLCSTNTFMYIFAMYGFLYGAILIFAFWRLTARFTEVMRVQFVLFLSFLLMFSNECMNLSLLFNTLVFFGLKSEPEIFKSRSHAKLDACEI